MGRIPTRPARSWRARWPPPHSGDIEAAARGLRSRRLDLGGVGLGSVTLASVLDRGQPTSSGALTDGCSALDRRRDHPPGVSAATLACSSAVRVPVHTDEPGNRLPVGGDRRHRNRQSGGLAIVSFAVGGTARRPGPRAEKQRLETLNRMNTRDMITSSGNFLLADISSTRQPASTEWIRGDARLQTAQRDIQASRASGPAFSPCAVDPKDIIAAPSIMVSRRNAT